MATLYYTVDDPDFDDYMSITVHNHELEDLRWCAEQALADYENNSNYEGGDPIVRLWDEKGLLLGTCCVYVDYVPTFHAIEIENEA